MARPPRRSGNLPAEVTTFIGRRRELADARRKLTDARLITLVGPGGVGKTRLAVQMATGLGRGFPDGAWLVELADVRDPSRVADAVMAALDLRDQAAAEPVAHVLSHLRDKRLLLVVDNCEHLLDVAGRLVTDVLRAAPGVRIIATSREPLSAPGEHVVPVPSIRQDEAVLLFAERAAAGSGTFELTSGNRAAVADLCDRLDGLPLAIELAAVRTRVLSVEQILHRLNDRFGLLTGGGRGTLPRHQTLRTTIDWSHDLLAADERTLLRRIQVFAGRFTLDDVEAVCGSTLDVLSSLVDKSLVMKEDAGDFACYRLHETMREYAGIKLREAGEAEAVERRCAEYYRSTCVRAGVEARFRLDEWLDWMDLEIDNIRSVLRFYLVAGDFRAGVALTYSLAWYWMTRATSEGIRWLDELLALEHDEPRMYARASFLRGFLAVLQSNAKSARPPLERAMSAAEETGQMSLLAQSIALASIAANMAGDPAESRRLAVQAHAVTAGLDDLPATFMLVQSRALNGLLNGDLDAVRAASSEGVRLSRQAGDLYSLGMMLLNKGLAMLMGGDLDESRPLFEEALRITHRIDDRVGQYCLLDALGCHAARSGRPRHAARLLGAAETVRLSAGAATLRFLAVLVAQAEGTVTAALGRPGFAAEFEAGKRLTRDAALALALGEPTHPTTPERADDTAPLGKREAEVARLVADGLSNKQIGARLFISEHTVDSHVRSILNKLGFDSRTQIAAWMAASDR